MTLDDSTEIKIQDALERIKEYAQAIAEGDVDWYDCSQEIEFIAEEALQLMERE